MCQRMHQLQGWKLHKKTDPIQRQKYKMHLAKCFLQTEHEAYFQYVKNYDFLTFKNK
jgi:hypothetical protein